MLFLPTVSLDALYQLADNFIWLAIAFDRFSEHEQWLLISMKS